jgi:spermidine synthase
LVPFFLLPILGAAGTVWAAALANFAVAAAAWWLDALDGPAGDVSSTIRKPSADGTPFGSAGLAMLAALSGVVTFALQVGWNRAFAQVHENSMHSFAVIVALVILALSLGAQLARVGLRRGMAPRRLLGLAWGMAGVAIMAGPWLFFRWSDGLAYQSRGDSWLEHLADLAGLGFAICFVPTVLLGVALPALMEHAGQESRDTAGRVLGRLFAFNVAGSVAGALLAGFLLPNMAGLWGSLMGLGAVTFAAGVCAGWSGAVRWVAVALAVGGTWVGIEAQPARVRVASGGGERLIALDEGAHGVVAVVEREGSRRLKLNNHYALGGTAAMGDERMQAHVPLLLHPNPKTVAFLGVGTGVTAGGATFHPLEKITAVELVPEVIAAARRHFSGANAGVLRDARVDVVDDDARHFLAGTEQRFDVIIGDLVVPWRAGEGALFTREQFLAAHVALAPGGLFCQWLPLFQLSEEELSILVRTFLSVFPNAQVWRGDFSPTEPAIALVGGRDSVELNANSVRRRIAEMRNDSANTHIAAPGAFWMLYVGELTRDVTSTDKRLNTENNPWVELLGPRLHSGRGEALFVGRKLEDWLAAIRSDSVADVEKLPAIERDAVAAGAKMAELVLCVSEGDRAGATRAHQTLRRLLPGETFRQLFP